MLQKIKHNGFTFIELLVVITIVTIIGATIIPIGSAFIVRNFLNIKTNELVSSLRTAQMNSINSKEDTQWGVEVNASKIKLFAVGNSSFDQTFNIPSSISITQNTILFNKLTGNPSNTATLTISSNAGNNTTIIVNEVGTVNVN